MSYQPKPKDNIDRITQFLIGKTIFISGGTGFLGKILVEKLLRSTDCKKIYLLIRTKKGKTPRERIDDIFSNMLFDKLKSIKPDALKRVHIINGDVSEIDLGISQEDRTLLENEVEIIYHVAATTRFDDTIKVAVKINTRGTKFMLELAEKCKKLKAFIHVSTAYAFPNEKILYEKRYNPPANPHDVLTSIEWIKEDEYGEVTKKLLGDCPNTYTFSKALAEALVYEKMDKIPIAITRPSVVTPTIREPFPGWCNNLQGPMGLFVGAGKGIIRSMYIKSESCADFVPADVVVNAIILASANVALKLADRKIFNITTSEKYNYTWEELINEGKNVIYNIMPFNGVVWYPGGSLKHSKWIHEICFFLFQIIPALFIDALLIVLGYKPVLYQIQRRIQKGSEMFEYYTSKAWSFSNPSLNEIQEILTEKELEKFPLDEKDFELRKYLTNCLHTVRINNLKETDDTLPGARRHMKVMWFVDKITTLLLVAMAIYYLYYWVFNPRLTVK